MNGLKQSESVPKLVKQKYWRVAKPKAFHSNALDIACQNYQYVDHGLNKFTNVGKAMKERCAARSKAFLTNVLLIVKLHNLLSNIMRNQQK